MRAYSETFAVCPQAAIDTMFENVALREYERALLRMTVEDAKWGQRFHWVHDVSTVIHRKKERT